MNQYQFDVMASEVDFRDQMHWHSLFGILQESAAQNAEDHGWGASTMDRENAAWVILRMSVRMIRRPTLGEKVKVETWSRGYRRLFFFRDFLIYDSASNTIGRATSMWLAVDKSTRRPIRPQKFDDVSSVVSMDRMVLFDEPLIAEIRIDDTNTNRAKHIVKYADYSEIDRNLHVNNTRYIAWSMDAANHEKLLEYGILSADINYLSEIKHMDKVDIAFVSDESEVFVSGTVESTGKLAFCCRLSANGYIGGNE